MLTETLYHVYDCCNTLIFIDQFVYDNDYNLIKITKEQYSEIVKTVEDPGMTMEISYRCRMRYYFREIAWNQTLLIGVKYENGIWKVDEYFENASSFLCP